MSQCINQSIKSNAGIALAFRVELELLAVVDLETVVFECEKDGKAMFASFHVRILGFFRSLLSTIAGCLFVIIVKV